MTVDCTIANGGSVCLSVHHTREPHLNGSKYQNKFYTTQYSDVSSFSRTNVVAISLDIRSTDITREQFKHSLKVWLFECAYSRRRV